MTAPGEPWTLDEVEALREGWDFEAKRAAGKDGGGKLPEDFWPTYSAMANTRGGHVVLGLKEEADGVLAVQGIKDAERLERELWDQLQNRQKVSVNLLAEGDVAQQEIEGKRIIVVRVPRATRKQRPVYLRGEWTEVYVRVGEGDRRLDVERIRRMMADAEYDTRDERVLVKYGLGDLNAESIAAYRNLLRSYSPGHPWLAENDQRLLEKLGGWRRDRESGEEGLTSAGLLFFGEETSIREVFPYYFLDYQDRPDLEDPSRWSDRITPDGTWSGNLFDFFRRVIPRIKSDLKVPFELDADLVRKDDTHISEALREAVVNSIIHADYEGRTSLQIVKSREGFMLRNPGMLRLSVEEIRQGGRSDCRNRTLQRMLALLGFGEQAGSGFSRILRAWREQHWVEPLIADDMSGDFSVLRLSQASLTQTLSPPQTPPQTPPQSSELPAIVREVVSGPWARRERVEAAIVEVCRGQFLPAREIAETLKRSHRTIIDHYLSRMVADGRLELFDPTNPDSIDQAYRTVEHAQ